MNKRYDLPTRVRLLGDYWAVLSIEENNEWTTYLFDNPVYIKFNDTNFGLKAIHVAYSGCLNEADVFEKLREVEYEQFELLKQLHEIAKKWYTEVILPRDEENGKEAPVLPPKMVKKS